MIFILKEQGLLSSIQSLGGEPSILSQTVPDSLQIWSTEDMKMQSLTVFISIIALCHGSPWLRDPEALDAGTGSGNVDRK